MTFFSDTAIEDLAAWQLDAIADIKRRDERSDHDQWANAEDMHRLYESGMEQLDIAERIERSQTHVSFCVKIWSYYLGNTTWQAKRPWFNEVYHSTEIRGDAHGKGENLDGDEWYTPRWIFDALDLRFSIDVAAPPAGPPHVPCDRFFTEARSGLDHPWTGTVWMNPPFSKITPWVVRWIDHGDGVALLPFVKSAWLHRVANSAGNIWIPARGFDFEAPDGSKKPLSYMVFLAGIGRPAVKAVRRVYESAGGALR